MFVLCFGGWYHLEVHYRIPESSIVVFGIVSICRCHDSLDAFGGCTILASYSILVFVSWWVVSFREYTIDARISILY